MTSPTEFLRLSVEDIGNWQEQVLLARRTLESALDGREHIQALSRLGELLHFHPDTAAEGIALGERALEEVRREGFNDLLGVVLLRRSISLQYAGRHHDALLSFGEAALAIREWGPPHLRHFELQHRGKCLAELGRLGEAREAVQEALSLRLAAQGDCGLVESSRETLQALDKLLNAAD